MLASWDRIKCILLLDTGKSPESIAEYLFLSRNTVANYLKRYQAGGLEDLGSLDDYQGSECRLSEVQQRKLNQHLEETLYQTVSSIREHIQATYRVTYSLSGLRHLLRRLDFVYKQPKAIQCFFPAKPIKQSRRSSCEWLRQNLLKNSERNRRLLCWWHSSTT